MRLAFVTGEIDLPPRHAALPDVDAMIDDIHRAMRQMHAGRLVVELPGCGPDVVIHIGQAWCRR